MKPVSGYLVAKKSRDRKNTAAAIVPAREYVGSITHTFVLATKKFITRNICDPIQPLIC